MTESSSAGAGPLLGSSLLLSGSHSYEAPKIKCDSTQTVNNAMAHLDVVREESDPDSCDPESSVSRYLSENERFARHWFVDHATPDMVSEWLTGRGYSPDLEMPDPATSLSDSYARATQSGRNSVTSELFQDMVMCPKKRSSPAAHTLSRQELQRHLRSLQEPELLMELIRDIANELDVDTLCHKILVNVSLLTQSDRGSLFLAKGPRGGARHLVAKLFDVTPDSVLQDALDAAGGESRIPPIPFGVGIVGHVALTKENLNIKDAYQDPRFNKEIDTRTGYRTVSVMCQPILNFRGDVIGVAQCINKVAGGQHFTDQDQEVFRKYLTFCGIGVQNAQLFEMSVREFKRNQLLLSLAKSIFEESSSLERLIGRIMVKAQGLLQCEKCRVYLVDTEQHDEQLFYQRLDSFYDEKSSPLPPIFKPKKFSKPQDVSFATIFELRRDEQKIRQLSLKDLTGSESVHVHFARHVAATEQTFNWCGTNEEIKSSNTISAVSTLEIPAEKLRNYVLSIPIFNSDNKVIGVAQLVNKLKGQIFTECDISTLEAFSIFCGLGIYNTQMYENASKLMAKQKVALEVLSYHASSSLEETKRLMKISIPSAERFKLYSFEFSDFRLSDDDTCQAAIRMFMDLDLIYKFRIPYQVMCRWILSVKKNYRPVIYHNWRHALNVTQTVFAMLMTGHMKEMMSDIEMMALLVACLSHDLDHRGTNNSFQTKIESPLAILYSTSTMEHHHFDQCVMILNSEGNNILQSVSPVEYKSIISIVESAILSTDLALYFKKKDPFLRLLKSGQPDWKNPLHKELLRGMMMTACDVSAICKPWEVQKKVAELVAGEFFQQGDLEKEKLKEQPIAMMDREKKDELPAMQVGFIDCVCLPVYEALTAVQPALSPLLNGCLQNRRNWEELTNDQQIKNREGLSPTIGSRSLGNNTLNGAVCLQHSPYKRQEHKQKLEHWRMKHSSKHHREGACIIL